MNPRKTKKLRPYSTTTLESGATFLNVLIK